MGEKSFAVRVVFHSPDDTTLTDAQIEAAVQHILTHLAKQLNAKLRT